MVSRPDELRAPKLLVEEMVEVRGEVTGARSSLRRHREPTVSEVVAWLRANGAGEIKHFPYEVIDTEACIGPGHFLVIPVDAALSTGETHE